MEELGAARQGLLVGMMWVEEQQRGVDWGGGVWMWMEDVRWELQRAQPLVGELANRTAGRQSGFGDSK